MLILTLRSSVPTDANGAPVYRLDLDSWLPAEHDVLRMVLNRYLTIVRSKWLILYTLTT